MIEDDRSVGRRLASNGIGSNVVPLRRPLGPLSGPPAPASLLSCSLSLEDDRGEVNAFYAGVTADQAAFAQSVLDRYGPEAAGRMRFGGGRRWSSAVADMLVSEAIGLMLRSAADEPQHEDCLGFRVALELGFLR